MRFAADAMLGRLAKWLRIVGYDTFFERDIKDGDLMRVARAEGRLILTRDARLAKNLQSTEYLIIKDDDPFDQLGQLVAVLGLKVAEEALLSLCTVCNGALEEVGKEGVRGLVPEYVLSRNDSFTRCVSCGRIYWKGTHGPRIMRLIESLGIEVERGR